MSRLRKAAIAILSVMVVLGIAGGVGFWQYHKQPRFCGTCHIIQPYVESWESPPFLDYLHAQQGVTCLQCHEATLKQQLREIVLTVTGDYEDPLRQRRFDREWCLRCHEHGSYQEVIEMTEDLEPNPHIAHTGELECQVCHKEHAPSEYYCSQCHVLTGAGPEWTLAE